MPSPYTPLVKNNDVLLKRVLRRIPYTDFSFQPSHQHTISLTDDDSAASAGVAVYFDEDGTSTERLRFVSPTNADGSDLTEAGDGLVGMSTGAPVIDEISTFGLGGIEIAAAGDMMAAWDFNTLQLADITAAIDVRVLWTVNAAPVATDSVTWIVLYDQVDPGEAIIEPATALDTTIAAHAEGGTTAYILHRTAAGVINADTFDETARLGSLAWRVEADAIGTFSADEIIFLGLELAYTPQYFANINDLSTRHTSQGAA